MENNIDNNQFNRRRFGQSLEEFEVAKLRRKYEALGYEFRDNYRPRRRYFRTYAVDAYAVNRITGDEIVFEVKSVHSYNERTFQIIKNRRIDFQNWFPRARFMLVLAKEEKPVDFSFPELSILLLNYIISRETFLNEPFWRKQVVRPNSVEDIECTGFRFDGNARFEIRGYANFRFWYLVNEKEFRGEMLNDGIPFYYETAIRLDQGEPFLESCKITFDFSEFGLNNP